MNNPNRSQPLKKAINPLFKVSILNGSLAAVQSFIDRGHELNAQDEKGLTALMLAALKGHIDICELLLQSGADPLLLDQNGKNASDIAKEYGNSTVVKLFQKYLPNSLFGSSDSSKNDIPVSSNNPGNDEPSDIDLSIWEEEVQPPAPPNDETCLKAVSEIQQRISNYIPINKDHGWLDVDIDLPDIQRINWFKNALSDDLYSSLYTLGYLEKPPKLAIKSQLI